MISCVLSHHESITLIDLRDGFVCAFATFPLYQKLNNFVLSPRGTMSNDFLHVIRPIRIHCFIFNKITNGLVIHELLEYLLPDLHLELDALFIPFQPVLEVAHVVHDAAFDALPVFFVGEEVSANKGRWVKARGGGTVIMS